MTREEAIDKIKKDVESRDYPLSDYNKIMIRNYHLIGMDEDIAWTVKQYLSRNHICGL